jgi:hypothetical protein
VPRALAIATFGATGLVLVASPAAADNIDYYATANGSVATTDNANGAARSSEAGGPIQDPKGDVFTDVRPGFLITYLAPRMIHELNSEVDFIYHFGDTRPDVTFRGGWKSFFIPTPRSELSTSIEGSQGQLNALSASANPLETATQVIPPGRVDTANASFSENLSWVASEGSRVWQRSFGRYTTTHDELIIAGVRAPDVDTESGEIGAAIGIDHSFRHDTLLVEAGGSYVNMEKKDPGGRQMGSRHDRQWNPRGVVVWQHDINKQWSTNIDAGVVYVMPTGVDEYNPDQDRKAAPFPVFGGVLAYTDVWGRVQAAARRQVTPNLFIAQNTVSDSLNLTGAMPITFLDRDSQKRAPKVIGLGTIGFERTHLIDPITSETSGRFNVARIDLAVGWSPRPGQTVGLRYELMYQNGDQIAGMQVPDFLRNTFYFTFALRWPEELQVRVPRRGQSVRADRKDQAPLGAEPVIVDPQEFLEGGGSER